LVGFPVQSGYFAFNSAIHHRRRFLDGLSLPLQLERTIPQIGEEARSLPIKNHRRARRDREKQIAA
jgi:hypothetical protein